MDCRIKSGNDTRRKPGDDAKWIAGSSPAMTIKIASPGMTQEGSPGIISAKSKVCK